MMWNWLTCCALPDCKGTQGTCHNLRVQPPPGTDLGILDAHSPQHKALQPLLSQQLHCELTIALGATAGPILVAHLLYMKKKHSFPVSLHNYFFLFSYSFNLFHPNTLYAIYFTHLFTTLIFFPSLLASMYFLFQPLSLLQSFSFLQPLSLLPYFHYVSTCYVSTLLSFSSRPSLSHLIFFQQV